MAAVELARQDGFSGSLCLVVVIVVVVVVVVAVGMCYSVFMIFGFCFGVCHIVSAQCCLLLSLCLYPVFMSMS